MRQVPCPCGNVNTELREVKWYGQSHTADRRWCQDDKDILLTPTSVRGLFRRYAQKLLSDPLSSELARGVCFHSYRACGGGPAIRGWPGGHGRLQLLPPSFSMKPAYWETRQRPLYWNGGYFPQYSNFPLKLNWETKWLGDTLLIAAERQCTLRANGPSEKSISNVLSNCQFGGWKEMWLEDQNNTNFETSKNVDCTNV